MSKYTLQVNVDGAVANEWHDLSISSVGKLMEDVVTVDHHTIEEFLTDLMIETEATMSTWWKMTNTVYYGHREI